MKWSIGLIGACLLLIASTGGHAQTPPADQVPPPPVYRPGLGDLMTMAVQPRHTKLGLAGQAQNWPYAAYELHELQEAFDRVARFSPRWRNFAVAETMQSVTSEPMTALAAAIKGGDAAGFTAAYKELTETCNLCHRSAGQGVIVIQLPTGSPFPDQDFRPVPR